MFTFVFRWDIIILCPDKEICKFKYVIMRNFDQLPKTLGQVEKEHGIITLKAVYKNAGAFTVCPVKDPQRPSFYLGVEKLAEDEKKTKNYYVEPDTLSVKIKDGKSFNLADEVDRINWEWIKHVPEIAMSFEEAQASSYETRYYVLIEEIESRKTVKRLDLKMKALNLVNDDDPTSYSSRVRLLGMDMRGMTGIAQKEFLMEEADRNPERVIDVYDSDSVGIRLLVLNALDKGIIDYDQRIYSYNTTTLGMSEDAVIDFLTRTVNKPIYNLIQGDLTETITPSIQNAAEVVVETVEPVDIPIAKSTSRPRGGQ